MAALQKADATQIGEIVPASTATTSLTTLKLSGDSSLALTDLRKEWNRRRQELGGRKHFEMQASLEFTIRLQKLMYFVTWKVKQSQYRKLGTQLKELKATRNAVGIMDSKNEKKQSSKASGKSQSKQQK